MPRKKRVCLVEFLPAAVYYKPAGIPLLELDEVNLSVEELEAIRLKDLEGLDQEQCAEQMQVARTTFQRVLYSAHSKIATALVDGKALRIEGGHFKMPAVRRFKCTACSHEFEVPFGNGQKGIDMTCPKCGQGLAQRISDSVRDGRIEMCGRANRRCKRSVPDPEQV